MGAIIGTQGGHAAQVGDGLLLPARASSAAPAPRPGAPWTARPR
eukprot:CAMPEP_0204077782 /NCGR_PEP_ID=MMETSP0360-20130528/169858_1 /ASSEMBLY_ACC=CAM_ASM_000342 /TAXON_ID=268821 /ORGANISM="Scrippsiella Hangoei, Strain SHTV-5" /LENGTH=43 /DNA_ID= /DNA_START= /DNA_END= /DNA_ORIENTATION=